jgi:hypothetical protein
MSSESLPVIPVERYDLFNIPPTNVFEDRVWTEEIRSGNVLADSHILSFYWKCNMDEWLDLREQLLFMRYRLYKADGSPFTAEEGQDFVLERNFFHNIFQTPTIKINDVALNDQVHNYAYLNDMETLLQSTTYQEAEMNQCTGWYTSDGRHMDGDTITGIDGTADDQAPALRNKTRAEALSNKPKELLGTINVPVFKMRRVLLPGSKINIDLKRWDTCNFFATFKTDYSTEAKEKTGLKVTIEDIYFQVKKRKLSSNDGANSKSFNSLMLSKVMDHKANYPILRPVFKTFSIPTGSRSYSAQELFTNRVPTKVIIGFVESERYHGHPNKTPFAYQHFNITKLYLTHGQLKYPSHENLTDFSTGKGVLELWLNSTKKLIYPNDPTFQTAITYEEFSRPDDTGFKTLWVIDLTANQKHLEENDHYYNPVETGNVGIMVETSQPFATGVTMLVSAYFEDQWQIDGTGNVYKSYF